MHWLSCIIMIKTVVSLMRKYGSVIANLCLCLHCFGIKQSCACVWPPASHQAALALCYMDCISRLRSCLVQALVFARIKACIENKSSLHFTGSCLARHAWLEHWDNLGNCFARLSIAFPSGREVAGLVDKADASYFDRILPECTQTERTVQIMNQTLALCKARLVTCY